MSGDTTITPRLDFYSGNLELTTASAQADVSLDGHCIGFSPLLQDSIGRVSIC